MSPASPPDRSAVSPRLARIAVFGAAVLAPLLLWTAPASAEEAAGGRLDWGVKASFRTYLTGPIAEGEVSTGDGASVVGGDYRFHSASGAYDPATGVAAIDYRGWVHFWGHGGELDVTFADPSIEYSGSSGTLYVYVDGTRTDMAALSGPAIGLDSGTLTVDGATAVLTANGATAFAGYYEAGQELDPVSFTADLVADAPAPEATEEPEDEPAPEPEAGVSGAVLDWGVRASWRDYVSGDLAEGSWTATDGASDGGAVFRFTDGEGRADGGDFALAFTGSVAFTGVNVDLVITDPAVVAVDGAAVLSAEIGGERLDVAEFGAELTESGELLVAQEVPTVLAAASVDAFGGFYQAGDAMDPISIAVPLTADAAVPALPDLGSEPDESLTGAAPAPTSEAAEGSRSWTVAAAAAGLAAIGAAVVIARRRMASATADQTASASDDGPRTTPEADSTESATEDKEHHHP